MLQNANVHEDRSHDELGRVFGTSLGDSEGEKLERGLGTSIGNVLGRVLGTSLGDSEGDELGRVLGTSIGDVLGRVLGTSAQNITR